MTIYQINPTYAGCELEFEDGTTVELTEVGQAVNYPLYAERIEQLIREADEKEF